MRKMIPVFLMLVVLILLYSCSKKPQDDEKNTPLSSAKTESDVLCICTQFEDDIDVSAEVEKHGELFTITEIQSGAEGEESCKIIVMNDYPDESVFLYCFDDTYLAEKAYNKILCGEADGAYPTNFMGMAGSLVRIGRYVLDDSLSGEAYGETLQKLLEIVKIELPPAQKQEGFERRSVRSDADFTEKGLISELKLQGYTVIELAASMPGAKKSYLICEDNGVVAGRLDISSMEKEALTSFYEQILAAYNQRIGVTYTDSGLALFSWYKDCMNLLPAAQAGSDTAVSE